jgi:hypothetical protein
VSVPVWAAELASAFWARAGEREPFPRNLRHSIAKAVPLTVVLLPGLSIDAVLKWLQRSGIVCDLGTENRPLRACLVARYGHGVAFVDGSDAEAEQRFSLAHELAHFLRDYWQVRQQVANRVGPAALEVLDGVRPATREERLDALLTNTGMGLRVHLMERDVNGNPASGTIADAERSADRLAYELLAPAGDVLAGGLTTTKDRPAIEEALRTVYGLPRRQASQYAGLLVPSRYKDPILSKLRKLIQRRRILGALSEL